MPVLDAPATSLSQELHSARVESDRLFSILKREALYERPIPERHRVIFYIGHLDGFDFIQICRKALGYKIVQSRVGCIVSGWHRSGLGSSSCRQTIRLADDQAS